MNEIEDDKPRAGALSNLRLRTVKSSRQSFARILRAYAKGELDDTIFKAMVNGLNVYLSYLKTESEQTIEVRLTALEESLKRGT